MRTVAASSENLYATVPRGDPLHFRQDDGYDYQRISGFLDFDANELSKIGGISKKSVRLDNRIPRVLAQRLEQIAIICSLVAEYFDGDPEKTALWFRTPNPMLGDISPRDMIRYGRYKRLLKFIVEAKEANKADAA